jgi:hypothetical protein
MKRGLLGITYPKLPVLYYITVHPYRGIFFYSPILLLYFFGVMWLERQPCRILKGGWRPDAILSLYIVFGYLLFNASYYMWWGGWAVGARHLLPMVPFMIPALITVLRKSQWYAGLVYIAGGLSIFLTFIPSVVDAQMPQRYHTSILLSPRVEYNLVSPMLHEQFPSFFQGKLGWNLGRTFGLPGLWSLLPIVIMWVGVMVLVSYWLKRGGAEDLRLAGD